MGFASASGRDITKDNLTRAMAVFSIRRAVQEQIVADEKLWMRWEDVFTKLSYSLITDEFTADCMVYSLFVRQSKQTSLRDYHYKGADFRVINEFYPFSREETIGWAVDDRNMPIQVDADTDTDRVMYTCLTEHDGDLSDEARALLKVTKGIYRDSMKYRDLCAQSSPRFQTNSWDVGWMQIQRMIFGKERVTDAMLDRRDEFTVARAALGRKIADAAIADGVI